MDTYEVSSVSLESFSFLSLFLLHSPCGFLSPFFSFLLFASFSFSFFWFMICVCFCSPLCRTSWSLLFSRRSVSSALCVESFSPHPRGRTIHSIYARSGRSSKAWLFYLLESPRQNSRQVRKRRGRRRVEDFLFFLSLSCGYQAKEKNYPLQLLFKCFSFFIGRKRAPRCFCVARTHGCLVLLTPAVGLYSRRRR